MSKILTICDAVVVSYNLHLNKNTELRISLANIYFITSFKVYWCSVDWTFYYVRLFNMKMKKGSK